MADDEDEESFAGAFEEGHWEWDDSLGSLFFVSDRPPEILDTIPMQVKAPTGTIEFRDDIDLLEQLRFRKRYYRKLKPGEPDVVTIQDVKDLVIYTAPLSLLSPALIDMLHLPTTERFLRALIFYCQYYLQTAEVMSFRMLELETKVRTPQSEVVECQYRENLCDLRTLVAKEYCTMLIGGADTKKFHHMGPQKKRRSLSDKDARLFETLMRMCVQIVWIALSRRSYSQIELEVHRIFKSDIFNSVEHMLKANFTTKMMKEERKVLLGHCLRHDQKLNTRSPLLNEVFCSRPIDFRMMGLGVIKYPQLEFRLLYMWIAITAPEAQLVADDVPVGILGHPRSCFDTMLTVLPTVMEDTKSKSKSVQSKITMKGVGSTSSQGSAKNKSRISTSSAPKYIYGEILIPEKASKDYVGFPASFIEEPEKERRCSETQRRRWHRRLHRLLNPGLARHGRTKSTITTNTTNY